MRLFTLIGCLGLVISLAKAQKREVPLQGRHSAVKSVEEQPPKAVLFPAPEGHIRRFGLSVEALYGAYILEPVPMYTGESPESMFRIFWSNSSDEARSFWSKRSYGRYSDRLGLGVNLHFAQFSDRYFAMISSGLFRTTLNYTTSPFLMSRLGPESTFGFVLYYLAREQLQFLEVPLIPKFAFGGKAFSFALGIGPTYAFRTHQEYQSRYYVEFNYPLPFLYQDFNNQGPVYGHPPLPLADSNPTHPMPSTLLFWSGMASAHVRIYRWISLGLEFTYDRQARAIASEVIYNTQEKRIIRYGMAATLKFNVL